MAILKVAHLGNPVIRKGAEAVPKEAITSSGIQRLVDDMVDTMHEYDGVGIAAPQVHLSKQVVVIEVTREMRSGRPIPLTILINPRMTGASKTLTEEWEGCLSVKDLRGRVSRAQWVDVEAFNRKGERITFHAEGFFARVIQHECDHLAGKVFLDRMSNLSTLSHLHEFARFWQE